MRYLQEAPQAEAMDVFYAPGEVPILTHTVWTGDFMCLCKHDIPCPICFDASAGIYRNVTPGQWEQRVMPCAACQAKGWEIRRKPWWQRLFAPSSSIAGARV